MGARRFADASCAHGPNTFGHCESLGHTGRRHADERRPTADRLFSPNRCRAKPTTIRPQRHRADVEKSALSIGDPRCCNQRATRTLNRTSRRAPFTSAITVGGKLTCPKRRAHLRRELRHGGARAAPASTTRRTVSVCSPRVRRPRARVRREWDEQLGTYGISGLQPFRDRPGWTSRQRHRTRPPDGARWSLGMAGSHRFNTTRCPQCSAEQAQSAAITLRRTGTKRALPASVIQRMSNNFGRFRHCYQRALAQTPLWADGSWFGSLSVGRERFPARAPVATPIERARLRRLGRSRQAFRSQARRCHRAIPTGLQLHGDFSSRKAATHAAASLVGGARSFAALDVELHYGRLGHGQHDVQHCALAGRRDWNRGLGNKRSAYSPSFKITSKPHCRSMRIRAEKVLPRTGT